MSGPKIVTTYVYPPIPTRGNDWCAHYDGEEEAGNYGWGRTEGEAIDDFIANCQEHHDIRLGIVRLEPHALIARATGETA